MKTLHKFVIVLFILLIHQSVFSQEIKTTDTTKYNFFQVGLAGGLSNTFLNLTINSGYHLPLEYNTHISFLFSPTPLIGIDFQLGANISNLNFKFSDFNDIFLNAAPAEDDLVIQNRGYYFGFKGNLDILYLFRYAPADRFFKWTLDAGFGGIFYETGKVFYKSGYNSFGGNRYTDQNGLTVLNKINAKGLTPFIYVGTSFWFKVTERVTLGLNTGYNAQPMFAFDRSNTKIYTSKGDYWQTSVKVLVAIGNSQNKNKFFGHIPVSVPSVIENIIAKKDSTTSVTPKDSTAIKPETLKSEENATSLQDSTSKDKAIDSINVNKKKETVVKDTTKRKPLQFDKTVEQLSEEKAQELDNLIRYKGYFNGKTTTLTDPSKKSLNDIIKLLKKYPAARIDLNLYDSTPFSKEMSVKLQRDDVIEYLVKAGIQRIRIGGNAFDRALDPRIKETPDKQRSVIIYLAK